MSIAADSSHYDYINYEKTNLAAKVHGFLQTTKNNLCFVLQDAKFVVPTGLIILHQGLQLRILLG
jgi:hypothetical protein